MSVASEADAKVKLEYKQFIWEEVLRKHQKGSWEVSPRREEMIVSVYSGTLPLGASGA